MKFKKSGCILLLVSGILTTTAANDDVVSANDVQTIIPSLKGSQGLPIVDGSEVHQNAVTSVPTAEASEKLTELEGNAATTAEPLESSRDEAEAESTTITTRDQQTPRPLRDLAARQLQDCCGGNGGNPSELICPDGTWITRFEGYFGHMGRWDPRYGNPRFQEDPPFLGFAMKNIEVTCSNGAKGKSPGGGDHTWVTTFDSPDGFLGLKINSNEVVNQIDFLPSTRPGNQWSKTSPTGVSIGTGSDTGLQRFFGVNDGDENHDHTLRCKRRSGERRRIVGLKLRTGLIVDKISFVCGVVG